jgi:hypothetical protein
MVMKRFAPVLAVLASLALGACNKPTPEECRAAILNMEKLLGTEAAARNVDNEGEIRRCRGGSSKEAVTCAAKAATLEDLKACAFMAPKGSSSGSAPATAGSGGAPAAPAAAGSGEPATPSNK